MWFSSRHFEQKGREARHAAQGRRRENQQNISMDKCQLREHTEAILFDEGYCQIGSEIADCHCADYRRRVLHARHYCGWPRAENAKSEESAVVAESTHKMRITMPSSRQQTSANFNHSLEIIVICSLLDPSACRNVVSICTT